MTTPTVAELLKFANLQMAAEAFLKNERTGETRYEGEKLKEALVEGNARSTMFSPSEAARFVDPADGWTVVDQEANTSTGFSGTLFRNNRTNELVISFRSTEFIDDAARDNEATNKLEIADAGFAFGQIADMEAWYARLKASNQLPAGATFSVTGYSLGGHLATVFNQLHQSEMNGGQVITFNGAGIGKIGSGTLAQMLATFQELLAKGREGGPGLAELFQSQPGREAYAALRAAIAANGGTPATAMRDIVANTATTIYQDDPAWLADKELLLGANGALTRALQVQTLANEVAGLKSGNDQLGPAAVAHDKIGAENIDYQLAVLATRQQHQTEARSIAGDASAMLITGGIAKESGGFLGNQYDIVAWEYSNNSPSAVVAHSLWHYGQDMKVFIEDQPLWRGGIFGSALSASLASAGVRLLVDGFSQRDFGDTHSLVLLVDSLNNQNTLLQLAPGTTQDTLNGILKAASNLKRENGDLLGGAGQGKSEGDALETSSTHWARCCSAPSNGTPCAAIPKATPGHG